MSEIRLVDLTKNYGSVAVVKGIELEVQNGEFIVLVGPSGCGKTTTLRMIAGLESATVGDIFLGGKRINSIPPKSRNIAMVFQSYALYPHMSVFDNIGFALRMRGQTKDEVRTSVERAAEALGLSDYLDRKPGQLSGGQRQRVAMGRAIVRRPEVFLFDEPLSNLDAKLRVGMRTEIKRLHKQLGVTSVYVTHDQVEAMTLADRIVVMNGGRIEQVGTPQEMYETPRTRFVAGFIGSPTMNFMDVELIGTGDRLSLRLGDGTTLAVPAERNARYGEHVGKRMIFGIRPEHLAARDGAGEALDVQIDVIEPLGMDTMVYFQLDGSSGYCARVHPRAISPKDQTLRLSVDMSEMHLIDPTTDLVV